jgi:polysaccharide pyruvyl transferase WcaK-like protein
MPTVLLVGAFGQDNPGDEALLEVFLRHLDGWRAVATSSDPADTRARRGCEAVSSSDPKAVALQAVRADAVVFAGGTIFKTLHPSAGRSANDLLRKGLVLAAGARAMGKPVAMLGVGAGRLDNAYADILARAFAHRSGLLVLRDEESAVLLAEAGLRPPFRIGADPAWALFDLEGEPRFQPPHRMSAQRRDEVIVALSHLADDGSLTARITAALRPLVSEGVEIKLQPWQNGRPSPGDTHLARELQASLGAELLPPPRDLKQARDTFAACRLVVSFRYHALIAASIAGTPFVSYGHEAKLIGLSRRLRQPCVSKRLGPEALTETIRLSLDNEPAAPDTIAREIDAAHEGFRLLRLLLDGGEETNPEDVGGLHLAPSPSPP